MVLWLLAVQRSEVQKHICELDVFFQQEFLIENIENISASIFDLTCFIPSPADVVHSLEPLLLTTNNNMFGLWENGLKMSTEI